MTLIGIFFIVFDTIISIRFRNGCLEKNGKQNNWSYAYYHGFTSIWRCVFEILKGGDWPNLFLPGTVPFAPFVIFVVLDTLPPLTFCFLQSLMRY